MASNKEDSQERPDNSSEKPPAARRGRWALRIVLALVVLVGAAVFWREPLAGFALRAALKQAGFAGVELSVDGLTASRLALRDVRLGGELAVRSAEAAYDLTRLPANPVTRLTLDGVRIDLTGEPGPLRQGLASRPAATAPATLRTLLGRAATLPSFAGRDLSLRFLPAGSTVTLAGSAEGGTESDGAFAARYDLRLAGELGGEARNIALDGRARVAKDALSLEGAAKTADGSGAASLALRADLAADAALIGGEVRLKLHDPGSLGGIVPALEGAGGDAEIVARTVKSVPVGLDAPLKPPGIGAVLETLFAGGVRIEASVGDGSHPAGFEGVDGKFTLTARDALDIPDRLQADGRLSLRMRQIVAPSVTVEDAEIAGPFRLSRQDDTVTLVLPQPLRFAAADIQSQDGAAGLWPVALSLGGGRTHALRVALAKDTANVRLRLESRATALRTADPAGGQIAIAPFTLRLAGTVAGTGDLNAAMRVEKLSATEGDRTGVLDDVTLTVKRSGTSTTADLRGRVSARHKGQPLLHPVLVQSNLSLWRDILTFDAKAILPGLSVATAKGRADLFAGTGTAALALPSFHVSPEGGEFRALAPSVSGLEISSGTLRASADLSWDDKGVDGKADFAVEDLALKQSAYGTTVQGLNGALHFDRIVPPRTPPGQSVRATAVSAAVTFDNPDLRFALIEGSTPETSAVRIEAFETAFAGGRLSVAPTVLDAAAGTGTAAIAVDNVDLAALLGAIGLDGISGTGRLSGTVPVGLAGKAIVIGGGRLAAAGPGVLRIRSEAAKSALAGGGAEVALMLSALEDFRYETLTLDIEKEAAGEGRVILRTKGNNPAVQAGRSFVINLNVSGNVDRLAAVVAQALQLPGDLVRSMLPAQP